MDLDFAIRCPLALHHRQDLMSAWPEQGGEDEGVFRDPSFGTGPSMERDAVRSWSRYAIRIKPDVYVAGPTYCGNLQD
jgi:hypothetical protein